MVIITTRAGFALPSSSFTLKGVKPCKSGYPQELNSVGDHIRKVRMDRNLFQKDVANTIGVTEDCITNWENNRSVPQISHMPAIIKFIGYEPGINHDQKGWGKTILSYRQSHGMTRKALAKEIGIDERTLRKLEKGEGCFFRKTERKIKAFLKEI